MGGEWYAAGLRFECTRCGACCTGPPGTIRFTRAEARRIAGRLGISLAEFLAEYAHLVDGVLSLREVEGPAGLDCVFLERPGDGTAVCSLYDDRPTQCRTFPFWPELLRSRGAWARAGRLCEGIGRGDFVPIERVRIERDAQAAAARSATR